MQTGGKVMCGIEVSVESVTANATVERPLIRSVFAVHIMTPRTFLRRISTLDLCCRNAALRGIPGNLIGNMTEIGGTQVGVHSTRFVAHGGHRQLLVGKLSAFVFFKTLLDGPVDLLPNVTDK